MTRADIARDFHFYLPKSSLEYIKTATDGWMWQGLPSGIRGLEDRSYCPVCRRSTIRRKHPVVA
jgi:hypothetical protein